MIHVGACDGEFGVWLVIWCFGPWTNIKLRTVELFVRCCISLNYESDFFFMESLCLTVFVSGFVWKISSEPLKLLHSNIVGWCIIISWSVIQFFIIGMLSSR